MDTIDEEQNEKNGIDNSKNFLSVPRPTYSRSAGAENNPTSSKNDNTKFFSKRAAELEDAKLDNWRPSSSVAALRRAEAAKNGGGSGDGNASGSESDDSIKELMARVNAGRKKVNYSERSKKLLEESQELIESIQNREEPPSEKLVSGLRRSASAMAPLPEDYASTFPRVNFDDMIEEDFTDKKPAWLQLQESIKTSYHKPKRTIESHKEMNEANDYYLNRMKPRQMERSQSPFSHLDGESFLPRAPSWYASGAMQPRGLYKSMSSAVLMEGTGPYAAPALSRSKGIEGDGTRYDRLAEDMEARLLKVSILPEHMKTITKREFRRAPLPSAGSASEDYASEVDLMNMLPRPFYSRPTRDDPDYFDFDLQHSVNMYRKPEGQYHPRGYSKNCKTI